ncbi:hypothetical protein RRF57_008526 [Xylaria bambusicola]|uniref:Uncharacterized protein n=1 Tax=Xylaria bambusicola TaxID=326684 RepID=A0AAN7Z8E8_9PEZI
MSFAEICKGRSGRKSHGNSRLSGHRRPSGYDFEGSVAALVEKDDLPATTSSVAHTSRGSRKSTYDTGVDYLTKKAKVSSSGKKTGYKQRI